MRKELLFCPLTVSRPVGVQPQGDVGGLHRLPYHPDQIIAKCAQVCFVAQLGREGFHGLCSVVLTAIEAPVNNSLNTPISIVMRSNRPTMAWYSLDRRTASGSSTSLASYTNPPVRAAPARAVRSGRMPSTTATAHFGLLFRRSHRSLSISCDFQPLLGQRTVSPLCEQYKLDASRHVRRQTRFSYSRVPIGDRCEIPYCFLLCYRHRPHKQANGQNERSANV